MPIGEDPAAHGHWCAFIDLYHTIPYHTARIWCTFSPTTFSSVHFIPICTASVQAAAAARQLTSIRRIPTCSDGGDAGAVAAVVILLLIVMVGVILFTVHRMKQYLA